MSKKIFEYFAKKSSVPVENSNLSENLLKNIKIEPEEEFVINLELESKIFEFGKEKRGVLQEIQEKNLKKDGKNDKKGSGKKSVTKRILKGPKQSERAAKKAVVKEVKSNKPKRNLEEAEQSQPAAKKAKLEQAKSKPIKSSSCRKCKAKFPTKSDLDSHTCSIKCQFCPKTFPCQYAQNKHLRRIHDDKFYTCDLCYAKVSSKSYLIKHMKKAHADGKVKLYICDFCGKVYRNKGKLYYHMNRHLLRVECKICKAKLKPASLSEHLKDYHVDERQFQCKTCLKTFKAAKDVKRHEKTHDKKFTCKICSRKFRLEFDMKEHVNLVHENPKSFQCDICSMKFNEKVCLKRHRKRHERRLVKDLKCDKCDYETFDNQLFRRHKEFHQKLDEKNSKIENPFKCDKCYKMYASLAVLKFHITSKHCDSTKHYKCKYCGKMYTKKKYGLKHERRHAIPEP